MKFLSRVVWSEGMHLSPQHFQMQSRYFEDSLWFLSGSLRNHPWGLLSFALDADAVRNGRATLRYASGIFPDGLVFEVPDSDPIPEPLSLSDLFSPTDSELLLHLAVPGRSAQGLDTDLTNSANSRYGTIEHVLRDETISTEEYPVTLGRKNLLLCSAAQLTPNSVSFPVARILRDGKGGFIADETFLPPLLHIGVVEDLLRRVKRLSIAIEDKIAVTRRGQKRSGQFEAGSSALDVANYWFLHALCSVAPALNQQLVSRKGHPEELYSILAEMSGSLCTFSFDSTPDSIPAYDHLHLNRTFSELEDHILRHLEIIVPSNVVTLDFRPAEQYVHIATIADERCFRRARWILGVRSNIGDSTLLRLVPNLVKCCSAEGVVKLVQRALPGLDLVHLPIPPSALAAQVDMHYFSIDTRGPCWEHTLATKQFGVYLPGDLGNATFEVTILVEATA
ncbi:type VI secretion system baseplate subunit TssK [Granulicella paludicola]|uniref:type VI secretion system baseplate subunit TssK n=1 Tax=Granulicella paludicola TaxID=474951 RepID=UPI0021E0005B|nr:type VI secretion system baseplate subunit TssK [Granulicella paludicola]